MDFTKILSAILERGGRWAAVFVFLLGLCQLALGITPFYMKDHEKVDDAIRGAQGLAIAMCVASILWNQKINRDLTASASKKILDVQATAAAEAAIRAPGPSRSIDSTIQTKIDQIERTSHDATKRRH